VPRKAHEHDVGPLAAQPPDETGGARRETPVLRDVDYLRAGSRQRLGDYPVTRIGSVVMAEEADGQAVERPLS
jgi:hypothetical protein